MSIIDDEDLAMELLGGQVDTGERWSHTFLKAGSQQELAARRALARVLRHWEGPSTAVLWRLASLFDPDSTEVRQAEITARHAGEIGKPLRDINIANDIATEVARGKGRMESAISAAMARYSVSRQTALRAWRKHKAQATARVVSN